MAPKKKAQKIALADFLADSATGSWADEMEQIPIAPAAKDPNALKRGDPGYFASLPDRGSAQGGFSDRAQREELPLPTKAPWTAFIGNLSFETDEGVLGDWVRGEMGLEIVSAKIIKGHDDKPKGFGYVEFTTLDGLKEALARSGEQLNGRTVRISVAEPPKDSRGGSGFGFSAADTADQWRRSGPLEARSPSLGGPTRPSNANRMTSSSAIDPMDQDWGSARGGKFVANQAPPPQQMRTGSQARFEGSSAGGAGAGQGMNPMDQDWGSARGGKFVPSAEAPGPAPALVRGSGMGVGMGPGLGMRKEGGFGGSGSGTPVGEETPDDWRGARAPRQEPVAAPVQLAREVSGRGAQRAGGFMEREVGLSGAAAAEETWSRGTKFSPRPAAATPAPAPAAPNAEGRPDAPRRESSNPKQERVELGQTNWRSARPVAGESTPTASAKPSPQPAHAQPRNLAPGSTSTPPPTSPGVEAAASPSLAKSSPATQNKPIPVQPSSGDWRADRVAKEAKDKVEREAKAKERAEREAKEKAEGKVNGAVPPTGPAAAGQQQQKGGAAAQGEKLAPRGNAWARGGKAAGPTAHVPARNANAGPNQQQQQGGAPAGRQGNNNNGPSAPEGAWRRGPAPSNPRQNSNPRPTPTQPQSQPKSQPQSQPQHVEPQVDADGFTIASGPGSRKNQAAQQAAAMSAQAEKEKKDQEKRNKFSFAAAMKGVDDYVEGDEVEEVREGVERVQV